MDIGESRFEFKCLACEAVDYIGGFLMGTGKIGAIIAKREQEGCSESKCGGPMLLYYEEMHCGQGEYSEKSYRERYKRARQAYLEGKWIPPSL